MRTKIPTPPRNTLIWIISCLFLLELSCSSPDGVPYGALTGRSDCKNFVISQDSQASFAPSPGEECLEYFYDGRSRLILKHINAGFNCCPGTISAGFYVLPGAISIKEKEESSLCDCNCLYDLTYELMNIRPGAYRISVKNPYQPPDEPPLEFVVSLKGPVSGTFCVPRKKYPWGY